MSAGTQHMGEGARELADHEIAEELQFHLAELEARLVGEGLDPAAARAEARRRFGDLGKITRACQHQRNHRAIMLQRINLLLSLVLIVGLAFASLRHVSEARRQRTEIKALGGDLESLKAQNAALLGEIRAIAAGSTSKGVQSFRTLPPKFVMGTTPSSHVGVDLSGSQATRVRFSNSGYGPYLGPFMERDRPDFAARAVRDLGVSEPKLKFAILALFRNSTDAGERLVALGDPAAAALTQLLGNSIGLPGEAKNRVRRDAATVLGQMGGGRALHALLEALKDEDLGVRCAAALALGELGNPFAVPYLEAAAAEASRSESAEEAKSMGDAVARAMGML